jgi:hypothetical protein
MSWVRQAKRALAAGNEVQVQPRGAWLTSYFKSEDELTLSPVDPVDLCCRDLVFIQRKSGYVIRLVLDTRADGILVGKTRDEGEWIPAEAVLGRVTRIAKQYAHRDTINPKICYDYLSAGTPPAEAWGDYGSVTFDFRARYDYWEFVLSPDAEFTAFDVGHLTWYDLEATQRSIAPFPEEQVAAFKRCFVRSGQYGKQNGFDASYMSEAEVLRIIRECISAYESGTS